MTHAYVKENRLLAGLEPQDLALLGPGLEWISLGAGSILFEPGEDVTQVCFPGREMIASLVLDLDKGASAEAAMIGYEGAVGGIISQGEKPAYARGVVQVGGGAVRISTALLDDAKSRSPTLRERFSRYADCLLAQVLQSVACNAVHDLDARLARWLLTLHDRLGHDRLRITQEFISQMLGVQRSYTTRILGELAAQGAIEKGRGVVEIVDRSALERRACECYDHLRRHFDRVLPGVYPH